MTFRPAFRFWRRKTAPVALDGRLRQSPHVRATAQGDEVVLVDTKGERYYTLNEVASRAWTLLAGGTSADAHVDAERELRAPSVLGTMLFIGALKTALELAGFERSWRWMRRHADGAPVMSDVDPAAVAAVERAVAMALVTGRTLPPPAVRRPVLSRRRRAVQT